MSITNKELKELENDYKVSLSRYQYSIERLNSNINTLTEVKKQHSKGVINAKCYQSYEEQTSVSRNAMHQVLTMNKRRLKEAKQAYYKTKNEYLLGQYNEGLKQFEQLLESMTAEQVQLLQEYKHLIKG